LLAIEAGGVGLVVLELRANQRDFSIAVTKVRAAGIGGLLMQAASARAARGAKLLTLCTADANLAALDLSCGAALHRAPDPAFTSRRQDACELEKTWCR